MTFKSTFILKLKSIFTPVLAAQALRTLILCVTFFIVCVGMYTVQVFGDDRYAEFLERTGVPNVPLPDLLNDLNLIDQKNTYAISDNLLYSFVLMTLIYSLFAFRRDSFRGFRRLVFLLTIACFMRTMTLLPTGLPSSYTNCKLVKSEDSAAFLRRVKKLSQTGTCNDMIFSGHTALATIAFMIWMAQAKHFALKTYAILHWISCVIMFALTKLHYTVDVVIAVFLIFFMSWSYNLLLRISEMIIQKGEKGKLSLVQKVPIWVEGLDLIEKAEEKKTVIDNELQQV
jgi:hypothetical protein